MLHVNATSFGGGVAEILYSLVPLMNDAGLQADWKFMFGRDDFFNVTKKIHNSLQGDPGELTDEDKAIFERYNLMNVGGLTDDYDFIVIHDPQPAAFRMHAADNGAKWIWRCHIDLSTPNPQVLDFLLPMLETYDLTVFHMAQYIPPGRNLPDPVVMPPAIDPLSPKNMSLSPEDAAYIVNQFGLDIERPLMLQVSRFDPWKDPLGVIDAYRIVKERFPEMQLALVGSMASDDPEGWEFFQRTMDYAGDDSDIYILSNLNNVGAVEVNAFQTHADVVLQKSIKEGFGLTVTEALWKARPDGGRQRGRHPAPDRGRPDRLSGELRGGGRRAQHRDHERPRGRPGDGPPRQAARASRFPDAAAAARLARDLHAALGGVRTPMARRGAPLILVSNRGPLTFTRGPGRRAAERAGRGRAGDRAAGAHRAHARRCGSRRRSRRPRRRCRAMAGGGSFPMPDLGVDTRGRFVAIDPETYNDYYNVVANPMLWFIQHYLWDLSNAPDIRREELDAWEHGYLAANRAFAEAVNRGAGRRTRTGS